MPITAFIALGSNLGDRYTLLAAARQRLAATPGVTLVRVSAEYETEPVGGPPGQGRYLNAAAELQVDLSPEDLLRRLLAIEAVLGRVRGEPNAPRTLDLDLLLYGDLVRPGPDPVLPHPRMHERSFVLGPLAEIAPAVRHPVFGVTVGRLHDNLRPVKPPGLPLAGLRALVTGSTSGIGRAIARGLAEDGAWVIVHGRRHPEATEELAAELRNFDVATAALRADLRDPEQCRALAEAAWGTWGGLEVCVNNAGADTLTGEAAGWPFERKLAELLAVDVTATMLLARDVGGRMQARGEGVVLTVGWDQAETGMAGDSGQLFAAAKGAVMAFTRSLALSLAPAVRVNCLAPGWARTAWGESASARWQERVLRETPLARWGTPEDVAAAARWLASPAAAFITGQTIRVNGGAVRG
jgi:2-amino-4-hydroxy-6-hydroxymethyldihydropteridine diphosphokinase